VKDMCYEVGTREEPGTLNTGWRPVFPGSSRLGIEPETSLWLRLAGCVCLLLQYLLRGKDKKNFGL
jgi:hypothetical protein